MKSILKLLHSSAPLDRGHIILDFDLTSFDDEKRKTVAQQYGAGKLEDGAKDHYVIVGIINKTGEFLIVPPEFRTCTFAMKRPPGHRPAAGHVNNPEIIRILGA